VSTVRGAPSTDRGRATRERILDTACGLFYRQGVRATGLDQIAEASGTGKGQLYHYFADKHDLIMAVIDRQIASVLAYQEPLLSRFDTLAGLSAWVELLVSGYEAGAEPARCPLGALVAELALEDPQARTALEQGFAEWARRLARGLRAIQDRGELAPGADADQLAGALIAAYEGGLVLAQARGDALPVRGALSAAVRSCRADMTLLSGAGR
jgi:TetR/AcrR family transcriptional regulator, transcriptional repressor for nem operon